MADERSIDEILASLDRLLNEGEGRNDEPADLFDQSSVEESAGESAGESVEAPEAGFFMALDRAVSEPYNEAEDAFEAVGDPVRSHQSPVQAVAGSEAGHDAATRPGAKRIVLTDAMLVRDVQQSLPLAVDEATRVEPEPESEPEPEPDGAASGSAGNNPGAPDTRLDERDIQALVDQVTDDVCSAIAEQLPEMIRRALAHRLSAFVDERMRHQDSEPEE